MHTLIVVSHPSPSSLTHAVAAKVAQAITDTGSGHTVEIADIAAEGFDPRFTVQDHAFLEGKAALPSEIAAEHARVDRADTLVLVYPVYWWSFPALLKGWIDRVFTLGWAYGSDAGGNPTKKLARLRVHLVGIGGADLRTYERHGYPEAMRTQIDHGIFDYCGAKIAASELLLIPEPGFPESHFDAARSIGQNIVR